jgi:hypothetical protein
MDPITIGLAATGLASSVYGGWKAGQERKKMDKKIGEMERDNQAFYNANALGDYTQRSDAQNVIGMMRKQLDRQTKRANDTAVITGATPEAVALQKQGANEALAGATSNIAAIGQLYKDRVTDRYLNRKDRYGLMRLQQSEGAAQGYEALMQTGLNTAAGAFAGMAGGAGGGGGLGVPGAVKPVSTTAKTVDPLKNLGGKIPGYQRPF